MQSKKTKFNWFNRVHMIYHFSYIITINVIILLLVLMFKYSWFYNLCFNILWLIFNLCIIASLYCKFKSNLFKSLLYFLVFLFIFFCLIIINSFSDKVISYELNKLYILIFISIISLSGYFLYYRIFIKKFNQSYKLFILSKLISGFVFLFSIMLYPLIKIKFDIYIENILEGLGLNYLQDYYVFRDFYSLVLLVVYICSCFFLLILCLFFLFITICIDKKINLYKKISFGVKFISDFFMFFCFAFLLSYVMMNNVKDASKLLVYTDFVSNNNCDKDVRKLTDSYKQKIKEQEGDRYDLYINKFEKEGAKHIRLKFIDHYSVIRAFPMWKIDEKNFTADNIHEYIFDNNPIKCKSN